MTNNASFPAAILFDHDGTLVDTEPVWAAAKVALAAEFGGTWTEQDTLDCLGLSMKFTLDRLRERGVDLPDEQINERLVAKVREALAHQQVEFLPGIERFLTQVRDAQIPAAIVTNATTSIAQRPAGSYGQEPGELENIIRYWPVYEDNFRKIGATTIDCTQPSDTVLRTILTQVDSQAKDTL